MCVRQRRRSHGELNQKYNYYAVVIIPFLEEGEKHQKAASQSAKFSKQQIMQNSFPNAEAIVILITGQEISPSR